MRTIATHIIHECKTNRQLANRVLKALKDLTGIDNGTIRHPYEDASTEMPDGRTLIETIYEDGEIRYNDGALIVEADYYTIYVDYTSRAIEEYGINMNEYTYITNIND